MLGYKAIWRDGPRYWSPMPKLDAYLGSYIQTKESGSLII